jgi:hypothetical protein
LFCDWDSPLMLAPTLMVYVLKTRTSDSMSITYVAVLRCRKIISLNVFVILLSLKNYTKTILFL